jgi:hypothetical protein
MRINYHTNELFVIIMLSIKELVKISPLSLSLRTLPAVLITLRVYLYFSLFPRAPFPNLSFEMKIDPYN